MPGTPGELHPSLWRTCRALANRPRLRIFGFLLRNPDRTVSEVADTLELSLPAASQYLRLLNARGLLRVSRSGRNVRYRVAADPSVPETVEIVAAVEAVFRRARDPVDTIFRAVTAFTHPRRILIVKQLGESPMGFLELKRRTGISPDALRRHLVKLEERQMVTRATGSAFEAYRLSEGRSRLSRVLLRLASQR